MQVRALGEPLPRIFQCILSAHVIQGRTRIPAISEPGQIPAG